LIPLHWVFINNMCLTTYISINLGDYKNSKTTSQFSENNLMWLYTPLLQLFGWKFDNDGMDKITTLHSFINILFIWYYCFYIKN